MRWLPRSMAGQLLALLLLAMGVTHLVAVLMLSQWLSTEQLHPLSTREIELRIASVYQVAVARPDEAVTLASELSLPESSFSLLGSTPAMLATLDAQEAAVAQALRTRLGLPVDAPLRVRLHRVEGGGDQIGSQGSGWALDIDLPMPDGRWLRSRHWPEMMHGHWNRILSFSIPVGLLPVTLIAFIFGRRIMRPLKALRDAARRISHGDQSVRLQPDGPSDVREVAEAFNDMQERLIRFVEDRTRMIAAIGHDLRTPLASLRIRAELVDEEELREAMIQTLGEMTVMAESTLRFAQDDPVREPMQDVDLSALVRGIVDEQRMLGREVALGVPASLRHRCRPVHLGRALANLIDNAGRYGGVAVVLLRDEQSREIRIEVDDRGPGIDETMIARVFEPFVRLDANRHVESGGSGLGLAIARSCVRAHGGDIVLENRTEGGLRATIALPF